MDMDTVNEPPIVITGVANLVIDLEQLIAVPDPTPPDTVPTDTIVKDI
jgi:hypothetical protein